MRRSVGRHCSVCSVALGIFVSLGGSGEKVGSVQEYAGRGGGCQAGRESNSQAAVIRAALQTSLSSVSVPAGGREACAATIR